MPSPTLHDTKIFKQECQKAIFKLGHYRATESFLDALINKSPLFSELDVVIQFYERLGMAVQERMAKEQAANDPSVSAPIAEILGTGEISSPPSIN